MVLMPRMTLMAALALLVGCIPKTAPVTLETPQPVAVAFVYDADGPEPAGPVAEGVREAVLRALEERNLEPVEIDGLEEFARRKASGQRLRWLAEQADGYVLLIEARATYYNQINGLYRWDTSFKATMSAGGDNYPTDVRMSVPVFLRFSHEKALQAQDAAKDVVGKRVGRLADTVLGGSAALTVDDGTREARAGPTSVDVGDEAEGAEAGDGLGPVVFVMVDRFRNGDPSNDGDADPADPQARHGGDLRGVIQSLDYLQGLGVKTVWLSPVFDARTETIGEWGGYHGYWVTGAADVAPAFGTIEDLRELSDGLHARGMKLLLDVVTNHVGYDTRLVSEKPEWFHGQGDIVDWADPVQAVEGDVHGLPDLAQEREPVAAFLIDQAKFWIDAVQPDGFRLDAVRHVGLPFWQQYTAAIRAHVGDDFVLLGELFDGAPSVVDRFWREGGFSHMFDFPLHYALLDVACGDAHPGRLASVLAEDARYANAGRLVTFVDNHDLPRVASRCADAAAPLELLHQLRGVPSWTWGTEQGFDGAEEPANRASLDWDVGALEPWKYLLPRFAADHAAHAELAAAPTRIVHLDERGVVVARSTPALAQVISLATGEEPLTWETLWGDASVTEPGAPEVELLHGATAEVLHRQLERRAQGAWGVTWSVDGAPAGELRVVGASPVLGDWSPEAGLPLGTDRRFPGGSVLEYKLVAVAPDGSVTWEPRASNRYLFVSGEGPLETTLTWGG